MISVATLYYQKQRNKETKLITIQEAFEQEPCTIDGTLKLFNRIMCALYTLHRYDLIIQELDEDAFLLQSDDTGRVCTILSLCLV